MLVLKRSAVILVLFAAVVGVGAGALVSDLYTDAAGGGSLRVVVDAGHGYPDGGAVGVGGTLEKDVNLSVAKKTEEILTARGISVIMTRTGDNGLWDESDTTIRQMKLSDMHRRLEIIKSSDADLFITIHMNSYTDGNANGLHIFYSKNHPGVKDLCALMQDKISEATGAQVHSVKTAAESLFLIKSAPMPAILVECGFLSNADEEKKLADEEYRARIAWAISSAVFEYYQGS